MILNVWFKPCPWVVFLVLRSCSTDSKFATFSSVLQLCCKGTKNFWIYQILCQRIQLNLFKMMSAAKIQQQAKFWGDYFSKNRKKFLRAANGNFPGREPQLLSILSVSRLPVGAPFSHLVFLLCFYRYIVPLKQGDFLTFSVSHLWQEHSAVLFSKTFTYYILYIYNI